LSVPRELIGLAKGKYAMDLGTFIHHTLKQIIGGVTKASARRDAKRGEHQSKELERLGNFGGYAL